MESELESRLSVAGSAISAVEQMNASEKTHFITMCNQQRQQLYSLISWEFRYVSFQHYTWPLRETYTFTNSFCFIFPQALSQFDRKIIFPAVQKQLISLLFYNWFGNNADISLNEKLTSMSSRLQFQWLLKLFQSIVFSNE